MSTTQESITIAQDIQNALVGDPDADGPIVDIIEKLVADMYLKYVNCGAPPQDTTGNI